jgi:hypothetical protein
MAVRRSGDAAPLSPRVVRVVLLGFGAGASRPLPGEQLDLEVWRVFGSPRAELGRLWRQFEPWLRAEAKRLHIRPAFGRRQSKYYGEWLRGRR